VKKEKFYSKKSVLISVLTSLLLFPIQMEEVNVILVPTQVVWNAVLKTLITVTDVTTPLSYSKDNVLTTVLMDIDKTLRKELVKNVKLTVVKNALIQ
jgi:hypothetical protein